MKIIITILIVGLIIVGSSTGIIRFGSGGETEEAIAITPVSGGVDVTYISNVNHDFAVGGKDSSAAFWFDESAGDLTATGNLNASGYASTTLSLNTQGSGHIGTTFSIDGSATTTGSFYIGADLNVVGDMGILDADVPDTITASNYLLLTGGTLTGITTSTGAYVDMTTLKLTPSATPTPVTGKCFMDNDAEKKLHCYDGAAWKAAW